MTSPTVGVLNTSTSRGVNCHCTTVVTTLRAAFTTDEILLITVHCCWPQRSVWPRWALIVSRRWRGFDAGSRAEIRTAWAASPASSDELHTRPWCGCSMGESPMPLYEPLPTAPCPSPGLICRLAPWSLPEFWRFLASVWKLPEWYMHKNPIVNNFIESQMILTAFKNFRLTTRPIKLY